MCAGDVSTTQASKIGNASEIGFPLPLKAGNIGSPARAGGSLSSNASTASGEEDRGVLFTQLRKTRMCKFHLAGGCRDGTSCKFAHAKEELHNAPNLTKTKLCQAFLAGGCDNPACSYAHGKDDIRVSDQVFKKSLCSWFAKGLCRNGAKCRFAHGREELRNPQPAAPQATPSPADLRRRQASPARADDAQAPEVLREEIARMAQQMAAMEKQLSQLQQRVQHQAAAAPEESPPKPAGPKWLLPPQHKAPPGLIPSATAAPSRVVEPRWLRPPQWE